MNFTKTMMCTGAAMLLASGAIAEDMTIVSWGGAYSDSQAKAYSEPYMEMHPEVNIINDESSPEAVAKLRAMNETGNITWDVVDVTGTSKGRGFAGVMKRWNFGGGRASHGGDWTRKPGSIGMCEFPGKVYKGRKMPGHMGNVRRTVQNLEVVQVRPEQNLLLIKGAIPGPNGRTVIVRESIKKQSEAS